MINNKKNIVVLHAYNTSYTLFDTFKEIPTDIVDEIIQVAKELEIKHIVEHKENKGYGGSQKSCYKKSIIPEYRYYSHATSRLSIHP